LLDTSREFNESDLIDAQAKITADKTTTGMQVITEQMELAPKYADDTKKSMDYMRAQALQPLQQDLLNTADEYSKLNANIRENIEFTDSAAVAGGMRTAVQTQGAVAKAAASKIDTRKKVGTAELGEILSEGAERVAKKQNPTKVVPPKKHIPAPAPTPIPTTKNTIVEPISKKDSPVAQTFATPDSHADLLIAEYQKTVQESNESDAASAAEKRKTNQQIAALLNPTQGSNPPEPKEIILQVDGNVLGRVLLDSKYIKGGKTYSVVTTA
jgi:hypothetical protein